MSAHQSTLADQIKDLAGRSTADLIGIAPGDAFTEEELGELGRAFGPVRSVIVLAQHIVDPILTVSYRSGKSYAESVVAASLGDALLRHACWSVVERLRSANQKAAIARSARYGDDGPRHSISYKKAAGLSGIGALGKSNLLLHPEWGPWLHLRMVVTDADLPPDAPLSTSPCTGCGNCITACPLGALSEAGYNRELCEQRRREPGPAGCDLPLSPHGRINCEECRRACPVGTPPPRLAISEANHR